MPKGAKIVGGGPISQFIQIVSRSIFYADFENYTHFQSFSILTWLFAVPKMQDFKGEF